MRTGGNTGLVLDASVLLNMIWSLWPEFVFDPDHVRVRSVDCSLSDNQAYMGPSCHSSLSFPHNKVPLGGYASSWSD